MAFRSDWTTSLKALADDSRLRILAALIKRPFSVNDLGEKLGLSQYNVSKHLRILREAGLVDCQTKGTRHEYSIAAPFREHLASSRNVLDLGCCTFRFDRLLKKRNPALVARTARWHERLSCFPSITAGPLDNSSFSSRLCHPLCSSGSRMPGPRADEIEPAAQWLTSPAKRGQRAWDASA